MQTTKETMGKTRTLDDNHEQQHNAELPYKVDADADTSTFTSGQQKLAQNADLDLETTRTKTKTKSKSAEQEQEVVSMPNVSDSASVSKNENNSDGDKKNDKGENSPVPTAFVTRATRLTLVSNAVTVETENIAVAVAVEDGDGNNDGSDNRGSPTTRNKKQLMALSFVISVLMSVALIVFFNLREKQEPQSSSNIATRDSDSKNNGSENSSGTTPEEDNLQNTTEYLERQSALIKILTPLVGDPRVFDPESPLASSDRIAALERLVVNPLDFPIPVGDEKHVSNDNDTAATFEFEFEPTTTTTLFEDQVHKFRQHFVMTLFYYATNGETWENQYWFLMGSDECQWNSVRSTIGDDYDFFATSAVATTGIFCNQDGWVSHMKIYWNNLSGTLPSELSYFEDTLIEINLTGGSISGTIPESFEKLNNLATFSISENCLTGKIPERLTEIPSLKQLSIYNNAGLSGSINKLCDGIRRPEGTFLAADNCHMDDSIRSIECDCCTCCDSAKFECSDRVYGTHSFLYMEITSTNDYLKGFEKPCLSPKQKEWILEECPCIRSYITDWGSPSNYCTNCTEDGARPSHPPFLPVENNRRHIRH
uniref:L domain-like protein n=2 Tax=Pseudo-nitzschia australis TaxID=44445 RepID=A0A7S4ENS0_9STRA